MAKLQAICPHCDASFKLKDRKAVGKMVKCPSCSEPFEIEAHPVEEVFDDTDFEDDYGSNDPFDDEPIARPTPTKKKKSTKAKKRKKSDGSGVGQIVVFGIAGVMALGFLVAAGFGISYLLKGGDQLDTSYLPLDTEVVVHVKFSELMKSEMLKDEFDDLKRPGRGGNMFGFGEKELQPEDIRSITVGLAGMSAMQDGGANFNPMAGLPDGAKVIAVFKFHKIVKDDFSDIGAGKKDHSGTTYWTMQNPFGVTPAFWRASSKVVVVGLEKDVKEAIDRGVGQRTLSKFSFVDGGQDVVLAVRPNDPEALRTDEFDADSLIGAPDSLKKVAKDLQEGMLGLAIGANVDTDVRALVQIETDGETRATEIETNLNSLIDWANVNLDQYRDQEPKLAEMADAMFAELKVTPRGERVDIAMVFPGTMQDDLQTMPNQIERLSKGIALGAAVGEARGAARRSSDKSNLKQIGIAIHNYHDVHGELPTGIRDANGRRLLSWRVQILPYIEQANLYEQFNLEEPWNSAQNRPLLEQMPDVLRSPLRPELERGPKRNMTSYIAYQTGTMLGDARVKFRDVTDGTANTAMVVEAGGGNHIVEWTRPDERDIDDVVQLVGGRGEGFNILFGDGSVRFFATNVSPQLLRGMLTRGGAEDPTTGVGPGRVVVNPVEPREPDVGRPPVEPPVIARPDVNPPVFRPNVEPVKFDQGTAQGKDAANLKQIGLAIHNYHDTYNKLPTGVRDGGGKKLLSWRVQLLPFLEEKKLYEEFRLNEPWDSPHNSKLAERMPAVFRSPVRAELEKPANSSKSSYIAFQSGTMLGDRDVAIRDVTDGMSNTVMVVEGGTASHFVPWTKPDDSHMVHSLHVVARADWNGSKGFNVLLGDGSVRWFTKETITPQQFSAMLTRAGGETVTLPEAAQNPDTPAAEPTELALAGALLPANLPTKVGRVRPAIMLRITLTGGDAPQAKAYGMVEVESAKDDNGRDLRGFSLPDEVDYTAKMVEIEANNRVANGVHVYVVFSQPPGVVNAVTAKGKFQLELTDGSKVDVPFDLQNVVPARN